MDPSDDLIINVDLDIQDLLLAASQHDLAKLRRLIRTNPSPSLANPVNARDPETGFTPLHAAVAACEPDDDVEEQQQQQQQQEPRPVNGAVNGAEEGSASTKTEVEKEVLETVRFLLLEGAIWNDLDKNGETPGCIARRLGLREVYESIVDAGVRAELLLGRLDGYEALDDDEEEEEEEEDEEMQEGEGEVVQEQEEQEQEQEGVPELVDASANAIATEEEPTTTTNPDVTQSRYLDSGLTFQHDRLLDQDQNGVMMAWETEIMNKSAKALLPTPGLRVLNIGHGMGIVDGFFQEQSPAAHHIVEAHPEVVAEMKRKGWHERPGVVIHEGRWQDVLPALVAEGEMFDAIYYDTFAESYGDFREFFTEQVIGLLEQEGKWSFFNGMGADRQISYDVYQKVVEIDLLEAGFDADWEEFDVPTLEGEWSGVRRPYWAIEKYRLPLCRYMD
ncbi:protein-arginine N5-methyltransferase [Aspergillus saccharolyticus JOP 1030-1]|uniref:Arginine N-methyltransferase 2 n=1 Tax=Aspergillus saccharolyticus JOP 1030-1 TaxID=1450539 RepID=A0A318ZET4_9EURO|nr:putative arginine N-methyltransferase [Aspergillus saccharolyticus JOP 1030-1]PYH43143.1 putative arginine N-methyltransferase [Aspergillus saccharolyticus JOP 1030-1]